MRRSIVLLLAFAACGRTASDLPPGVRAEPLAPRAPGATPHFVRHAPEECGVTAGNTLLPENVLPYVYNGAGIASGDFDGDGLPDLYVVSQDGPNHLYRQTARFRFEDVTATAGVDGGDAWGTGCAMIDFDGDGRLDIYVSNTESPNLLYRNRGDGTFEDVAAKVGLAHVGASTMPAFADFDNDGDLDLYLVTNRVFLQSLLPELLATVKLPGAIQKSLREMAPPMPRTLVAENGALQVPPGYEDHLFAFAGRLFFAGQADRLFRNDGARFVDVTNAAGIVDQGLGLSATWWDYDDDGYLDLYVANDLESPDRLYHNRRDGTFEDVSASALPHIAYFGMGSHFADIDHDGRFDLVVADMAMRTHYNSKMLMGDMGDRGWFLEYGQPPQIMRNALFLNTGTGHFLEAARMAGVASTDWTWAVKFGDLDLDGWDDLFVTNGIPRFDNDPDAQLRFKALWAEGKQAEAIELARRLGPVKERNLALRNGGTTPGTPPKFKDAAADWGLDLEAVSQGATFVDLDRDGDLDVVVSNQNEPAAVFENVTGGDRHAIVLRLNGRAGNRDGLGARVSVRAGALRIERLLTSPSGYLSTDEPRIHVGLGDAAQVDRLEVRWPSGAVQVFEGLAADHAYTIDEPPAPAVRPDPPTPPGGRFEPLVSGMAPEFVHHETPFNDFAIQPLLPHRHSQLGPGMAWGDANGDGIDDLWVGGARGQAGALFVSAEGGFRRVDGPWDAHADREDMGALWFDLDRDGDLDLYVVSGSSEVGAGDPSLRDRIYRNDGENGFRDIDDGVLPAFADSGSVVTGADVDGDGDIDLFVGGRMVPGRYPHTPISRLYRNDDGKLVDVAGEIAPGVREAGLVTGACFTDLDQDGDQDLIVTAHWQPVRVFRNDGGKFVDASDAVGTTALRGWWNGVASGDVDGDGDIDLVTTNQGLNSKYKASPDHPARLFAKDFDDNGVLDVIEAKYEGDTLLPVRGRSCSSRAMPFLAERFPTYDQFARASLTEIYAERGLDDAEQWEATELGHVLWRNRGDGTFEPVELPRVAQIAPAFGVVVQDLDGDGRADVVLAQNFFTAEPETGRMAGGLSLLLRGTADGLEPVTPAESGVVLAGDTKGLAVQDCDDDGHPDLVFTTNDGPLRVLRNAHGGGDWLRVHLVGRTGNPMAVGARLTLRRGATIQVREIQTGSGYLSQSGATQFFGFPGGGPGELEVRWPDGTTTTHPVEGPEALELRRP